MKQLSLKVFLCGILLATAPAAFAQTLKEASAAAARKHNARVISARTVKEGDRRVHVIKLLTEKGVVKTVRVKVR